MKVNRPKSIHGETLPSFLHVKSFKSIDFWPVKVYALKNIDVTLPSFLEVKSNFCILFCFLEMILTFGGKEKL